jgi:site-specific recombinase XerC
LHDLRHSHATHLLMANVHPKIVQERLGHANIATTLLATADEVIE